MAEGGGGAPPILYCTPPFVNRTPRLAAAAAAAPRRLLMPECTGWAPSRLAAAPCRSWQSKVVVGTGMRAVPLHQGPLGQQLPLTAPPTLLVSVRSAANQSTGAGCTLVFQASTQGVPNGAVCNLAAPEAVGVERGLAPQTQLLGVATAEPEQQRGVPGRAGAAADAEPVRAQPS